MTPGLALASALRREGRYDEAREVLRKELAAAGTDDARLACAVGLAKVERGAGRLALALKVQLEASPLAEASADEALRAHFHSGLGATYQLMGEADAALIEYTAAAHHWSKAGLYADAGCAENNVALILSAAGRFAEARAHLRASRAYFVDAPVKSAEVDESEAQVCLAEGDPEEALRLISGAMAVFFQYGEVELRRKSLPTLIKAAADCQASARRFRGDRACAAAKAADGLSTPEGLR